MKIAKNKHVLKIIIGSLSVILGLEAGLILYAFTLGGGSLRRNLDLGNKYLLEMDYAGAIQAFSKAIEIDGMSKDAYIGRGDAYKALGDYKNAWEDYEKAEELSGENTLLDEKIGRSDFRVVSTEGGVGEASVSLLGETHSYEFMTDSDGYFRETLFPETYRVHVTKENYRTAESIIPAGNGAVHAEDIHLELDRIPFTYEVLNTFMSQGYLSAASYTPDRYALIDIDKNGVPEIVFADDNEVGSGQVDSAYEVFCYDDNQGVIRSAGKLTNALRHYGIYYTESLPGLFTYGRTSGSHMDYVYEFDGSHMNWRFNSGWRRTEVDPYQYEVIYEDASGPVSEGIFDIDNYTSEYGKISPEITFEITMQGFNPQVSLTTSDIQG